MSKEIPTVLVLKAITPSVESIRSEMLTYKILDDTARKHAAHDRARQTRFWETEDDSLEEIRSGKQLAAQYMLMGLSALNSAVKPEQKQLWSERYTRATAEIYGCPDQTEARQLLEAQVVDLLRRAPHDNSYALKLRSQAVSWGIDVSRSAAEKETPFECVAELVGAYLKQKCETAYSALDLDDAPASLGPEDIASRFETALLALSANDSDWAEWSVDRNQEKDSLSVSSGDKKIVVGVNRANVTPVQLEGLFAHEVLVHANRALQGAKRSEQLSTGLPDYLDFEEGLGVFSEYAVTGEIPVKNVNRYVDIALALGLSGEQISRHELLDFVMNRAQLINDLDEIKKSQEDIEKEVYAHVNRIYRGSLGNEYIGVFTKDIAYHKGFLQVGAYIESSVKMGNSVADTMDFLLQGKFDPTNEVHMSYLSELEAS